MNLMRRIALTCTLSLLNACVTAKKFDPKAPVEIDPGVLENTYEQRKQTIGRMSLVEKLDESPQTRELLSGYKTLYYSSLVAGVAGGFMLGWCIGKSIQDQQVPAGLLAGGAGLLATTAILTLIAEGKLARAVRRHNELVQPADSKTAFSPFLDATTVPDGLSSRISLVGGLRADF